MILIRNTYTATSLDGSGVQYDLTFYNIIFVHFQKNAHVNYQIQFIRNIVPIRSSFTFHGNRKFSYFFRSYQFKSSMLKNLFFILKFSNYCFRYFAVINIQNLLWVMHNVLYLIFAASTNEQTIVCYQPKMKCTK